MHAVVPSAGPETGGTVLTVIGVGLSTDLAPGLSCRIDGTPVEAKLLAGESNAQSASYRVPPGAAGFVGVMFAVYNATGSGNAGGGSFSTKRWRMSLLFCPHFLQAGSQYLWRVHTCSVRRRSSSAGPRRRRR